ncbi:MAG: discoidin domain-containing protein [Chitinophagaceae bacterium]
MMKLLGTAIISFFVFCSVAVKAQQQNIALGKPVTVSSTDKLHPATNMVDGKITRTSTWKAANGNPPHIVEIDLQKYYSISEIKIHSGIMDTEKKADEMNQAAGFWSIKNFKLQYWDDANWSDFPKSEVHENRLIAAAFNYSPTVSTFKIRLVCDDGEPISIMEIEAFGSLTPNMPEPPTVNSSIKTTNISTEPQDIVITVENKIVGKTLKYVGYNQGYYIPGSNVSGWIEYSGVNSLRVWASLNSFVPPSAVQVDEQVASLTEFDKRKNELRLNPEKNKFIKWDALLPLYDKMDTSSTNAMVFSYAIKELKRLKVDGLLQLGSTDFENDWSNKWKQWQRYYAIAFYAAKIGDVNMFALQNEPNHRQSGPMKLDQWIMAMQIVSDAIHCAVEDVNKIYKKKLVPKFVGPVTAGNNPEWWAAVAKNIRTDYRGNKVGKDLLEIFSTHSYNSPAVGYENRIENIQEILRENHPAKKELPVAYTEIGRWMNAYLIDKEETMDSPSLFAEWAGIYSNNMKNGGYGIWAFKFANTQSGPYPRGVKSGHHFIWQGKRIVEDAYKNIALGKNVTASSGQASAKFVTDAIKTNASSWHGDTSSAQQWVQINLEKNYDIGSAVIYSGSDGGVYTSPDRIQQFKLQYWSDNKWKDIPGTNEKDNKYAQVFEIFKTQVTTDKVRMRIDGSSNAMVREIKLFEKGDGPGNKTDYSVSGIQRTGEVVRLFAKGFKNERPLFQTTASVEDNGLDTYTSYDEKSGNYYMWLVQRGMFNYNAKIDLSKLTIATDVMATAETVSPEYYGEVTQVLNIGADKKLQLVLPPQSVMLLTIPKKAVSAKMIVAKDDATVTGGKNASKNDGLQKELKVQLDAANPSNNNVAYLSFDLSTVIASKTQKVLLKVNGYTNKTESHFRLHVYGIPDAAWSEKTLNWNNAPLLDNKEALIKEVGQKAFVAGEIAFTKEPEDHFVDVTSLLKDHPGKKITFVLVRETRQLGDDEDKNKQVLIQSKESNKKPALIFYQAK